MLRKLRSYVTVYTPARIREGGGAWFPAAWDPEGSRRRRSRRAAAGAPWAACPTWATWGCRPPPGEEAATRKAMKGIQVGSRVRIADAAVLSAALRWRADLRPEPGQVVWAGRKASVTGYHRSSEDRSLYALKGAPGLWSEEWIDPI